MLEHPVPATEQLGLTRWFWRAQSNHLLITFIETHNVIVSSMISLVISFPITSIQEINQRGWQDRTKWSWSWSQWLQDSQVSLHPPLLLLVHARSNPVVHMLNVWLQNRLVRGRRDRSTLDLKISLLTSLTILWGNLSWTAFTEDLLLCSYTRYVCQLLQLFHHPRQMGDVVTHLPECFVRPGILFQLFMWPHLSLASEWARSILSTEDTLPEGSGTVR